jgi:hypothetical protein
MDGGTGSVLVESLRPVADWLSTEDGKRASREELRGVIDAMQRAVEVHYGSAIARVAEICRQSRGSVPPGDREEFSWHLNVLASGRALPESDTRHSASRLLNILRAAGAEAADPAGRVFDSAMSAEEFLISASHEAEDGDPSGVLMNLDSLQGILTAGPEVGGKYRFKVCLLGDAGVGKTSLTRRFVQGNFSETYSQTIGTRFLHREMAFASVPGGPLRIADLSVWDIMGHERLRGLLQSYLLGANGVLAVYSVESMASRKALVQWIADARRVAGDVPVLVLANKADIADRSQVGRDTLKVTFDTGCDVIPTSAKTGANVEVAFSSLVKKMVAAAAGGTDGAGKGTPAAAHAESG